MSIFADRLKELRGAESQASFAEQLDLNRVQYFKYESGKNAPSIDVLTRICRVHAVSADWLLGLTDSCSARQNNYAKATSGGIAIVGNVNRVSVPMVSGVDYGNAAACAKCPFKKKLKALEKVLGVGGGERK